KNRHERTDYFFSIVRLSFFEAENLLPQNKAGEHAEEPTGGQLRIHLVESALVDALLNVTCNRITGRHAGHGHFRKLMAFQRTKQKKTQERCVVLMPL